MNYNFNNDIPIYLQIVDIITKEITSGILEPGNKLPSVREYAIIFKANPNTVAKALQILEDNKLIYTERTNGKYVTKNLNVIDQSKIEIFDRKVKEFVNDLRLLGYSEEDLIKKIMEMKK